MVIKSSRKEAAKSAERNDWKMVGSQKGHYGK